MLKTNGGRRILKVFLLAFILATWTFVSIGCVRGITAPEEEWNRTFGGSSHDYGNSVKQTQDGGYIIAGDTGSFGADGPDVYLVKIDENGTEEWSKTYGGSYWDRGYSVQQTSDGGYIIAGETEIIRWDKDIYLTKTDADGYVTWSKTFGGWDWDEGRSVQQTSDGGYIITGATESFGDYFDVFLLKTYENGSLEWIKTFETFGGSSATGGESVQQTSDGGYIVVGTGSALGVVEEIYLIKTDEYGIEEWNKTFGGSDYDCASSVQQTADRGYIITGYTASFGNGTEDVYLIKTDEYGTEEWNKTFGGTDVDRGKSVQQTADRGYIITGYTASFGNGTKDVYLIKTDEYGTEEWNKTIGGASRDEGRSVQQTADGGYIIGGSTCSYGAGFWDVWLIKIAPLNQPPTATIDSITPNPAKQSKDTVSFIGHGNDSDGSVVAYSWTSSIDGLLNTSQSFTKPASELSIGVHTIYFKVRDDDGAWSTAAIELLMIEVNQPPVALFSYLPPNPAINETVTFNASASYDPDGSIVSYNWSFDDGNIANTTEAIITHSYASAGVYTVNLTVTDDEGATNTTSRVIKVFSDIPYFDTEPGTYPSIMGTHNGTITMTHAVNVSKIFIYPCTGTGGHVEYARIWNSSWEGAETHWHGYVDDWHNCSFDKNFTLVAGETYNYTIRTGSYPQIHHTAELLTAKAWITCSEFVDINGKRHEDWIPAIKLE